MSVVKTYVLLPSMDTNSPIYQTLPNGQREQLKKIPRHRPTLRQTFQDKEGVSRTIRYKEASKFVDQQEQIEKEKLDANLPFTSRERNDLVFKFGTLTTNKKVAQEYLEAHPEFEKFDGFCNDVPAPRYKILDEVGDAKIANSFIKLRVKAASKVMAMEDIDELGKLIIRLNGSTVETPTDVEVAQNMLMNFIDDAETEAPLLALLQEEEETTIDDKTQVLVGQLLQAEILTFTEEGNVERKTPAGPKVLRQFSTQLSFEEREKLFTSFLNSDEGKTIKAELEKDLADYKKASKKQQQQQKRE